MSTDPVETLSDDWQRELPDLETAAMGTVARLNRVRAFMVGHVESALAAGGSSLADFDVLSTLRRSGPPYRMMPSTIARSIMLSASGTTNRIDQLEEAGLVERVPDPENRRTVPVALTARGIAEAERLVRLLVQVEEELLGSLGAKDRASLDRSLAKLAAGIERPA